MESHYLPRTLEPALWRATRHAPVVLLTGPRASGKTTLARRVLRQTHSYVSLGRLDVRLRAVAAPHAFLDAHPAPVILDDVHQAWELLDQLHARLEVNRGRPGQYVLVAAEDQTAVARAQKIFGAQLARLRLLPLSQLEVAGDPHGRLPWEGLAAPRRPRLPPRELWERLWRGWYPEVVAGMTEEVTSWQASYGQSYLERDVASHRRLGEAVPFQQLLQLLARRSGQPLNLSALARPLGVAVNTVKAWLRVLEITGQVILLHPYPAPSHRRMVKTPRVYFSDVGRLCHLAGVKNAEEAASGPLARAIFATAVLAELVKVFTHRGEEPRLFFWRTAVGEGVDFVLQTGGRLLPLEARVAIRPQPELTAGIRTFQKHFGERAGMGYVVHAQEARVSLGRHALAVPFREI